MLMIVSRIWCRFWRQVARGERFSCPECEFQLEDEDEDDPVSETCSK